MKEEWRIIEEAPDFLVSNKGRVQNREFGKILKVHNSTAGYPTVNLRFGDRYFQKGVHQVVASAFVDGKKPGLIVSHIDRDKTNYFPENLKWMTRQEELDRRRKAGIRPRRKLRRWIVIDGELVEIERESD